MKKIYVGMSGGVDSSVSAAVLKKAGFDVTGVFIRVWQPDWIECNWREERREAMRAAAHLGIPFVTLDLEKEYKQGVIDYMIAEYKAGRTPNPDVMCNREVKFGAFWRWARERGADYVATGHYAQVVEDRGAIRPAKPSYSMRAGIDTSKDQSYFLWTLNQIDLEHILFPIGRLEKPAVRALARKFGLPNADKKDSQGLCFIGKIDVKDFLAHYIEKKPGDVLDENGEAIGRHEGSLLMTIGERHGFTIDAAHKTPHDERYYVISKDVERNTVTVSDREAVHKKNAQEIRISHVNWVSGIAMKKGDRVQIRARYRQPLIDATIRSIETVGPSMTAEAVIMPQEEIEFVAPGQSLVMYMPADSDGRICVGGGIIE
jgi:tRNA-uridine 2-sulfurtransferase